MAFKSHFPAMMKLRHTILATRDSLLSVYVASYGSLNLMLTSGSGSSDYVMHVIVFLFEYIALGVFGVQSPASCLERSQSTLFWAVLRYPWMSPDWLTLKISRANDKRLKVIG